MIRDLIEKEQQFAKAKAELDQAKADAIEYILDSGYDEVLMDGYKVKVKKTKKKTVKDSVRLKDLKDRLDLLRKNVINNNKEKVYQLQKTIFYSQMELDILLNNDMTAALEKKIEAEETRLQSIDYSISCRFNSSAAEAEVDKQIFNEYLRKGWKLKDECGKAISKGEVLKFLMMYKDENPQVLEAKWDQKTKLHLKTWSQ